MAESSLLDKAAEAIRASGFTIAFTGAGISVESGIPPFRGENGLWNKYDPALLEISHFFENPLESWEVIMEVFYDFFGQAKPNGAHYALAKLEKAGMLQAVITQNIDNLHQEAGSREIAEFHGNSQRLSCTGCRTVYRVGEISLSSLPVTCPSCRSLVKPDFIFFGEGIPKEAYLRSMELVRKCRVMLVIGTTAEVMPAGQLPQIAKSMGAKIIEVNSHSTRLTYRVSDIFLKGGASAVMEELTSRVLDKAGSEK
jgi:NAD-dependent deacetylase